MRFLHNNYSKDGRYLDNHAFTRLHFSKWITAIENVTVLFYCYYYSFFFIIILVNLP